MGDRYGEKVEGFCLAGFGVAAWRGIGGQVFHQMVKVSTNSVRMRYSWFASSGGLPTVSKVSAGKVSFLGH